MGVLLVRVRPAWSGGEGSEASRCYTQVGCARSDAAVVRDALVAERILPACKKSSGTLCRHESLRLSRELRWCGFESLRLLEASLPIASMHCVAGLQKVLRDFFQA